MENLIEFVKSTIYRETKWRAQVPQCRQHVKRITLFIPVVVFDLVLIFVFSSLRKPATQRKKYGLLSNYDDTVEMAQLESDEDDTTVYEAKSLRR